MPLAVAASINTPQQVSIWVWDILSVHTEIFFVLFPLIHPRALIGWFAIYLTFSLQRAVGLFSAQQTQGSAPAKSTQIWWEINPTGGTNSINTLPVSLLGIDTRKKEETVAKICFP